MTDFRYRPRLEEIEPRVTPASIDSVFAAAAFSDVDANMLRYALENPDVLTRRDMQAASRVELVRIIGQETVGVPVLREFADGVRAAIVADPARAEELSPTLQRAEDLASQSASAVAVASQMLAFVDAHPVAAAGTAGTTGTTGTTNGTTNTSGLSSNVLGNLSGVNGTSTNSNSTSTSTGNSGTTSGTTTGTGTTTSGNTTGTGTTNGTGTTTNGTTTNGNTTGGTTGTTTSSGGTSGTTSSTGSDTIGNP